MGELLTKLLFGSPREIPRLSRKEAIVLELLVSRGELYGLELVGASEGHLKRGTIYVTLGRMEQKGYVEGRQTPPPSGSGGLPRRRYRATALGSRALEALEHAAAALVHVEEGS